MPKILAIDDEIGFTKTIEDFFTPRGYEVIVTNQSENALDLVKEINPDVVLIDLKMPGLDGDQALKQILEFNPQAKVIMLTAFQDEGKTRAKVMEMGAFAFMEKPIPSMKDLATTIKEAIA